MEIEYACSVKNRFSAIKDSGDPFEAALASTSRVPKGEKKKKPPPKPTTEQLPPEKSIPPAAPQPPKQEPVANAAPPPPSPPPPPPPPQQQQQVRPPRRQPPSDFGEMTFHRGGGRGRRPYQPRGPPPINDFEGGAPFQRTEYRRGGSGGGGGRGNQRGGRRQFDRHSGDARTSIKAEEKRHGGGAHNWGRPEEIPAQVIEDQPVAEEEEPTEISGDQLPPEVAQREPSPETMTVQEWTEMMEKQKPKRSVEKAPARKAGEGENPNKWAKPALIIQKKKPASTEKTVESDQDEELEEDECVAGKNAEITSVVRNMFSLKPVEQPRGRGGRGGRANRGFGGGQIFRRGMRGGERGGQQQRGWRGGQQQVSSRPDAEVNYDLNDDAQFPKLS
ncbi:hypothetical protein ACOME3_004683 [Neoechinorhynchus agilis]